MSSSIRFKEIREQNKLNQTEFGDLLGFKQSKIKDIETGKQKVSVEIAELIEKKFSINLRWLLTGNGEKSIDQSSNIDYKHEIMNNLNSLNDKQIKYIYHITEAEKLKA